jgi:hypothetical protein
MVITGQNGTNCINCNPPPAGCSANGTWTDNSCNPPAIGLWNLNPLLLGLQRALLLGLQRAAPLIVRLHP